MVKKFYMETKNGTLEQSVLDVWQNAAEQTDIKMDGRTKGYRNHRSKLEARRAKREEKKASTKKEVYEIGTDEYRKYLERHTPGEIVIEEPVDPKDREELDTAAGKTAKKMKKAKEPVPGQMTEGSKEEYQKFFNAAMKKFKIDSPADLKSDEEKKKFYDYIDKNYTGEKDENFNQKQMKLAREFKVDSIRETIAKIWSMEEDKKEDHDPEHKNKSEKTLTGKKVATVDVDPDLKEKHKKKVNAGKSY